MINLHRLNSITLGNEDYIPYDEIIRHLPVQPGSMLMVTADLTRLAFLSRRKGIGLDTSKFIENIIRHLGSEGTLIIPSFNFNLRDQDHYSRLQTIPITGSLAVEAMKRKDFLRTKNPLHSFLVWGKQAEALAGIENRSSFGSNSPFAYFLEQKALMLLIDTRISDAFTFVHHVEEVENVRYRKMQKVRIYLEDENMWKEYLLFAKKKGWTMNMAGFPTPGFPTPGLETLGLETLGLETLLFNNQIARTLHINKIPMTVIDLAASFPVIRQDIRENSSAGIARFSLNIYLRDVAKAILSSLGIHTVSDKISHDPGLL